MNLLNLLETPEFTQQVECSKETYAKDAIIVEENDSSDEVFVVLKGEINVCTRLETDQELDNANGLAKLEAGDFFGELAIFDNLPRSARVKAATDCEIAKINGAQLIEYLDAHPERGYFIMRDFFMNLIVNLRENNLRTKTILQMYLSEKK